MKRAFSLFSALIMAVVVTLSAIAVFGADAKPISNMPYLTSISFNNAEIEGGFRQDKSAYSLILTDPSVPPSLKAYTVNGNANLFVTYVYDEASGHHQTGLKVTLSFENGTVIYTFNYKNATEPAITSNADLLGVICELGELQPQFNADTTSYKLYLPSDLTNLEIAPVTADVNAYCAPLNMQLREGQETDFGFVVTASDGSTKTYKFKIKRVNKTTEEIKQEMAQPDFKSFVDGEFFYQKPVFTITMLSVIGGALVIIILALVTKRITVNPYDSDEKNFYSPVN